ncbi:MAG TPA: radical SAM protein [Sedimentisphaerales bacterium]|nr:radical SAM protein [Sedimentisphaerales bacterium]
MKVLLIDPPFYRLIGFYNRYFPLGLASLATVLRGAGHEVVVYDADFNENPSAMDYGRLPEYYPDYLASFRDGSHPIWKEVRRTVETFEPELIGVSVWTAYAASAFHIAGLCREIRPTCPIVAGGPHATVKAEETLRICPSIDYVIRGDGETALLDLTAQLSGTGRGFDAVENLSFRRGGSVTHNASGLPGRNLDEIPIPDRALLKNRRAYSSEDMGLIMTSRGCPFSCAFCATETRRVRYSSVERVLAEIRQVRADYGVTQFSFKDDSFTVNRSRVAEFCNALLQEDFRIGWECNTRVDLITEDLLNGMKRAGCNSIKVGIESGSEAVLERMNKGITLDQVRTASTLLRKAGIHWTGYFLMGTPGETAEDVYRTLDFMYEIRPDFASMGVYEPFPGTTMFEEGLKRGLVKPDMTLEDFFRVLPNDYYKADARRQVDTMAPQAFEKLEMEMKARFHAYNKSVRRLVKRARSRAGLYWAQPALLLADFRKFLVWN